MAGEITRDLQMQTRRGTFVPGSSTPDPHDRGRLVDRRARARRTCSYDEIKIYDEELSLEPGHVRLDRLNSGAPVLDTHGHGS